MFHPCFLLIRFIFARSVSVSCSVHLRWAQAIIILDSNSAIHICNDDDAATVCERFEDATRKKRIELIGGYFPQFSVASFTVQSLITLILNSFLTHFAFSVVCALHSMWTGCFINSSTMCAHCSTFPLFGHIFFFHSLNIFQLVPKKSTKQKTLKKLLLLRLM